MKRGDALLEVMDASEPWRLEIQVPEHRIACGRRSLGYVLFGDVIEFVQRRFWW